MDGGADEREEREPQTLLIREGLVTETDPPRLVTSYCAICENYSFPEVASCPYCGAFGPLTVELSSGGLLWAWTAVRVAPAGYRGELPYGFGVVELPERIRVMTRLTEPEPSRLDFDIPMHLEVVPLHEDEDGQTVLTYAFAPTPGAGDGPVFVEDVVGAAPGGGQPA